MDPILFRGRIEARNALPGHVGELAGDETFEVTVHEDGLRLLRSRSRLFDRPTVFRDVLQSVDHEHHPRDAFTRIVVDGRLRGSAWYQFTNDLASCESHNAAEGRLTQQMPIRRGIRGFGAHALQSDAWLAAAYDRSQGPGVKRFEGNLMSTTDHRGSTGPRFMTTDSSLEYVGEETLEVAAGRFVSAHFRFVGTSHGYPPYDMWVTADGHYHFVKAVLGGRRAQTYELVELRCEPLWGPAPPSQETGP
jgi:hypothetical protein